MDILQTVRDQVEAGISEYASPRTPENLYAPVNYILGLGGKRIRPMLCAAGFLTARDQWEDRVTKACVAMEVFHNFSLVHDDIMDRAPMRRGKQTVHEKWNVATAILSGDVMLIDVFRLLREASLHDQVSAVQEAFHRAAVGVCEGQQLDMDFESSPKVSWSNYLEMIRGKTAVLLSGSLEVGAILGGAERPVLDSLVRLGECVGLGFQLMDDWLDCFGDPSVTGKMAGGDILRNKKTAPYIQAVKKGSASDRDELHYWYHSDQVNRPAEKVRAVIAVMERTGAATAVMEAAAAYEREAREILTLLGAERPGMQIMQHLLESLSGRKA